MNPDTRQTGRGSPALQRLLAIAMVAGFVACGVSGLKAARSRRTEGNAPMNSSDAFLFPALRVSDGSEEILDEIAGLPPLQPLAVIAPKEDIFGPIIFPIIGSVTWPHPIYFLPAEKPDLTEALNSMRDHHFAAVMLYDIPGPLPYPGARHVGALTILPLSK